MKVNLPPLSVLWPRSQQTFAVKGQPLVSGNHCSAMLLEPKMAVDNRLKKKKQKTMLSWLVWLSGLSTGL